MELLNISSTLVIAVLLYVAILVSHHDSAKLSIGSVVISKNKLKFLGWYIAINLIFVLYKIWS